MKIHVTTSLFMATLAVYSCGSTEKPEPEQPEKEYQLSKAQWLLGRWENNSAEGNLSETWTQENDSTLVAETFFVIGPDTVFREYTRLEEIDGKVNYVVTVEGQNGDKPVMFPLTKLDGHHMAFENPQHDFPQVITYDHKGDSVIAEISGMREGKQAKERFAMKKVN